MFVILYFTKVRIFIFLVSLLVFYNIFIHFVTIHLVCVIFCFNPYFKSNIFFYLIISYFIIIVIIIIIVVVVIIIIIIIIIMCSANSWDWKIYKKVSTLFLFSL